MVRHVSAVAASSAASGFAENNKLVGFSAEISKTMKKSIKNQR
jgi:hypothetical protein